MSSTHTAVPCAEVAAKLADKLKPSGWSDILKVFLVSEDFEKIFCTLQQTVADSKRFTPPLKNVFRAFEESALSETNVIIIGQDPYPFLGDADGIAFSCSNPGKINPSLRYMLNAINETVYDGSIESIDGDLARWANQGVLLLNTALTTEVGKIGKHFDIWQPFITYTIDAIQHHRPDMVWVLLGKKAEETVGTLLHEDATIFKAPHPASAAYQKAQRWDCKDVFNQVNAHLVSVDKAPIKW